MNKILLIMIAVMMLSGCTSGHPVPESAFTNCMDSGKYPLYRSEISGTTFSCMDADMKVTVK